MLYRSFFPRDILAEFGPLYRDFQSAFEAPAIRGRGLQGYPALNVDTAADAVEVSVFAPGLDPEGFDVQLERGVLSISGQRAAHGGAASATVAEKSTWHLNERFAGKFRRVVSLPDDVDPDSVSAEYRDGVLRVRLARLQAQPARRVAVQ